MRRIAIVVGLVGCSSSKSATLDPDAAHGSGGDGGVTDATIGGDAPPPPDAPDVARPLYALSGASLYAIDVVAMTSTLIAPITSAGTTVEPLDGLGFEGGNLLGIDAAGENLLVIDPATAAITATKPLGMTGVVGGLTVIPPNEIANPAPILLGASGDTLYRIAPLTGAVTVVGTFSDGAQFNTDLAWVHGHGLYITLKVPGGGSTGNGGVDLVQIDPASAATIADLHGGYGNINGLSGYRGHLWGVSQGGNVYGVDLATGTLVPRISGGPAYTEAAE